MVGRALLYFLLVSHSSVKESLHIRYIKDEPKIESYWLIFSAWEPWAHKLCPEDNLCVVVDILHAYDIGEC